MAELVDAKCRCGFHAKGLMCGALRSGGSFRICACYDCGDIKSLKSEEAAIAICENCRELLKRIDFYDNDYFICPRCARKDMWLMTVMMVD